MLEIKHIKVYKPKKGVPVTAINDISLKFPETGMIFLLGKSGSGKSTMLNLLGGLDRYDSGEIIINGKNLSGFSDAEKAKTFAYSGQDSFMFSTNIAQNITFQPSLQTDEEKARLDRALYISALAEDMELFPQGLETLVGEKGVRVSGGQRQRIALARAVYTGNPVLILDDPFSAVDINTEKKMIERIRQNLSVSLYLYSHTGLLLLPMQTKSLCWIKVG
jgi:ABC-type bacteriocin/lantibiotic exporter with double-glycine peptidase domain